MADEETEFGAIKIVFIVIMAIPTAFLLLNTLYRTYLELKEYYFDLFRLSQYLFLLVYLTAWMLFYCTIGFNRQVEIYEAAVWIASGTNIGYIVINLMLWILIIVHLSNLVKLEEGEQFIKNRKKVIKIEMLSIFLALLVFFVVLVINGYSALGSIDYYKHLNEHTDDENNFDKIDYVSCSLLIALYVVFIFSELFLIIKLMKLVHKYCAYDKEYSKFFPWLAGSNIVYYCFQLVTFIVMMESKTTYCDISRIDLKKNKPNMQLWLKMMLFVFNNNLPLVYAYMNIKNVSFKIYVANILPGIGKPYLCPSKISLFIVPSCRNDPDGDEDRQEESEKNQTRVNNSHSYLLDEDMKLFGEDKIGTIDNIVEEHALSARGRHSNNYFQLE
ncbi:unnamed protein product [Moneuplotes crassus]|uniref:Uncharacterized protein n=1 Tax=Euplotes crassus TaxID=5936 RepID=A0AAD1U4C6_EUPCR|nr:unnamed protein product [Moneuplotes crassus]